jgi:hypothetical protein
LDHGRTKPLVPVADLTEGSSSNIASSASDQRTLDIADSRTRTVGEDVTAELALELIPTRQDTLASRAESADDKNTAQEVVSLENYPELTLEGVSDVDSGREIKMVHVEENGPEPTLSPSLESSVGGESSRRSADKVSVGIEEAKEQREVDVVDLENQAGSHFEVRKPVKVVRGVDPMAVMEPETMNFFYRFLVARGLDVWLMATVLLLEWARIYLSPFADVFVWAVSSALNSVGRPSIEKESLGRIRGGSSADESDGEDESGRVSDGGEVGTT